MITLQLFSYRSSDALLKCYDCIGTDCSDEKTCSDSDDACIKNFAGEKDKSEEKCGNTLFRCYAS